MSDVIYVVYTTIRNIERRQKSGNDLGWFVHFEGSWESIFFGLEEPQLKTDDSVKITFQKQEPPCPPSQTTSPTNIQKSS